MQRQRLSSPKYYSYRKSNVYNLHAEKLLYSKSNINENSSLGEQISRRVDHFLNLE